MYLYLPVLCTPNLPQVLETIHIYILLAVGVPLSYQYSENSPRLCHSQPPSCKASSSTDHTVSSLLPAANIGRFGLGLFGHVLGAVVARDH